MRFMTFVFLLLIFTWTLRAEEPRRGDAPPAAGPDIQVTQEQQAKLDAGLKLLGGRVHDLCTQKSFSQWPAIEINVVASAGMLYLQEGSLPGRGTYGKQLQECLDFVMRSCQDSGLIQPRPDSSGPMVGHALATQFLAEIYASTCDEAVREKVVKAVHLIQLAQNLEGGWRHQPVPNDADVSVTSFQVKALAAARIAGVGAKDAVLSRGLQYIRWCKAEDSGFQLHPGRPSHPSYAYSASAISALCMADEGRDLDASLKYLARYAKSDQFTQTGVDFDIHMYALQAAFYVGGSYWDDFYSAMRDRALAKVVSYRWDHGGNLEDTPCAELMILQMPYRRPSLWRLGQMFDGLGGVVDSTAVSMPGVFEIAILRRYQQDLNDRLLCASRYLLKDESQIRQLGMDQTVLKVAFDQVIKSLSPNQPLPVLIDNLPPRSEAEMDHDDGDSEYNLGAVMTIDERIALIRTLFGKASDSLAKDDIGEASQEIQRRLLHNLNVIIGVGHRLRLDVEAEWAQRGRSRLNQSAGAVEALKELRHRYLDLEHRYVQANGDNLGKTPGELNLAQRKKNNDLIQDAKDLQALTESALRQLEQLSKSASQNDADRLVYRKASNIAQQFGLLYHQRDAIENMRLNLQFKMRTEIKTASNTMQQMIDALATR